MFKTDENRRKFENYLNNLKSKSEDELYIELLYGLELNDKNKYMSKIKFVGQPFNSTRVEDELKIGRSRNVSHLEARAKHPTPLDKRGKKNYSQVRSKYNDIITKHKATAMTHWDKTLDKTSNPSASNLLIGKY